MTAANVSFGMGKLRRTLLVIGAGLGVFFAAACAMTIIWMWWRHTPTRSETKLLAISAEARGLMARGWTKDSNRLPTTLWPPTIAGLDPEWVGVSDWGVEVEIESYFDGGWGYDIVPAGKNPPMPIKCYENLGRGIYWHGPC